ncbi:unnamed protein product [Chondrus crispus]|uniref:Uncharacterized protein n=1 Tax=Chondrus crispus TaxID=2769 RepID=R7Q7L3_CHOCR|nr:unnamed protein product [Chondrus crispus]CDF33381.1 unnamed protein product [Chondrus crispus]|eukprot:XP_005713184.1 unnamed protein product [Chondrus crispus]
MPRNFTEFDLTASSTRRIGEHCNKLTRRYSGGLPTDISCPCDSGINY